MYGLSASIIIQTVSPSAGSFQSDSKNPTQEKHLSPSCCFLVGSLGLLVLFTRTSHLQVQGGIFTLNPNSSQTVAVKSKNKHRTVVTIRVGILMLFFAFVF